MLNKPFYHCSGKTDRQTDSFLPTLGNQITIQISFYNTPPQRQHTGGKASCLTTRSGPGPLGHTELDMFPHVTGLTALVGMGSSSQLPKNMVTFSGFVPAPPPSLHPVFNVKIQNASRRGCICRLGSTLSLLSLVSPQGILVNIYLPAVTRE